MKKTLLISFIVLFLCLAIAIPIVIKRRPKPVENVQPSITKEEKELKESMAKKISNIKEYTGEIPEFTLELDGDFSATVTDNVVLDNIPIYEFDAGIDDTYDVHVNHYVGINYWDLLKYYKVPNHTSTSFISNRKSVNYRITELDYEKTFIVFYRDGKLINDGKLTLLAVNYTYSNSVEDLTRIEFN